MSRQKFCRPRASAIEQSVTATDRNSRGTRRTRSACRRPSAAGRYVRRLRQQLRSADRCLIPTVRDTVYRRRCHSQLQGLRQRLTAVVEMMAILLLRFQQQTGSWRASKSRIGRARASEGGSKGESSGKGSENERGGKDGWIGRANHTAGPDANITVSLPTPLFFSPRCSSDQGTRGEREQE